MSKLTPEQKKALICTLFAGLFIVLALGFGFGLGIKFITNYYTVAEKDANSSTTENAKYIDHLDGTITSLTETEIVLKSNDYDNLITFKINTETSFNFYDFGIQADPKKSRITAAAFENFNLDDEIIIFSKEQFLPNDEEKIIALSISKIIK